MHSPWSAAAPAAAGQRHRLLPVGARLGATGSATHPHPPALGGLQVYVVPAMPEGVPLQGHYRGTITSEQREGDTDCVLIFDGRQFRMEQLSGSARMT